VAQSLLQDTIRQLRLELRTRYYRVILTKAELQLAREVLSQFDEIIRLNEVRFQRGEVSGLDLARVQTERLRFFSDQVAAEVEIQNSKTALLELLGTTDMGALFDVTESLAFSPLSPALGNFEEDALVQRSDLLARRKQVEREQLGLALEKANAIPNVIPFVGYKRDFRENTLAFGVNVSLPIFNRNQGGIARATARIEQAGFERQRAELAVRSQVRQAYEVVQGEERRVRELESTYVPKAGQARDIAQAAYRLGSLDLIGFLDAERAYRETLRGYNQALFDHQVAIFVLEAAVGKEQ
jgi:cobalt-zinc-cadmium efflux system outer membrane protein